MGDIPDGIEYTPVPVENIHGLGVAGPPVDGVEAEISAEVPVEISAEEEAAPPPEQVEEEVIRRETAVNGDEALGRNIDVKV